MSQQRSRLKTKLAEQLSFLATSSQHYDHGIENEAIRLAVTLRVLFYDKPRNRSLLQQLSLNNTKMLSSLKNGSGGWMNCLSHKIDLNSPRPIIMIPQLRQSVLRETSFDDWWDGEEIFRHENMGYTRSKIILSMAHKDGGAHVDKLQQYYKVLSAGKWAIGITGSLTYSGAAPFQQGTTIYPDNAHFALVRQFAYEVLASAEHYKWQQ